MKALIGVDPHKATVAVAVVDEVLGELVECASFLQNRAGFRALERWAKRFPKRRWAVENASGLGRNLAQRLAAAGESVVDVPPKLVGAGGHQHHVNTPAGCVPINAVLFEGGDRGLHRGSDESGTHGPSHDTC